jgi:hypothetical protein
MISEEFFFCIIQTQTKAAYYIEVLPSTAFKNFTFSCRDPNNNTLDDASSPKLNLVTATRHGGLDGVPKQNGLTHVDFPCLPQSHGPQTSIKLESHEMQQMLAANHEAMLAQNVAEFAHCLPETHMLNTLTPSLVGL